MCGAVRYALSGPLRGVVSCHCSQCRRTHGHYAAYTGVATYENRTDPPVFNWRVVFAAVLSGLVLTISVPFPLSLMCYVKPISVCVIDPSGAIV